MDLNTGKRSLGQLIFRTWERRQQMDRKTLQTQRGHTVEGVMNLKLQNVTTKQLTQGTAKILRFFLREDSFMQWDT